MNIIDLRRGPRRTLMTRRITDRRSSTYQSGSPEWLENSHANYRKPESDRCTMDRRTEDRRILDRRQQPLPERNGYETSYPWIVLAPEERKLLEDLYLNDTE